MERKLKSVIWTAILSGLGYLFFTLWVGWEKFVAALMQVGVAGVLLACLASLFGYLLRFIRWDCYLKMLGYSIPTKEHLKIYLSGFALVTTPGRAGEALRGVFLKDYGVPYRKTVGAFLAERVSDLIAMMFLTVGGVLTNRSAYLPMILLLIFLLVCFLFIQSDSLLKKTERFFLNWLPDRFSEGVVFVIETVLSTRTCFQLKALMISSVLGVLSWGLECTVFYFILQSLNVEISYSSALFVMAFGQIVGALSFLPGGLGGTELTMLELLRRYGAAPSSSVAATIISRLTTLWFASFAGLFFFVSRDWGGEEKKKLEH